MPHIEDQHFSANELKVIAAEALEPSISSLRTNLKTYGEGATKGLPNSPKCSSNLLTCE